MNKSNLKGLITYLKTLDLNQRETLMKALVAVQFEMNEDNSETYNILEDAIGMYWEACWIRNPFNEELSDYIEKRIEEIRWRD